MLKCKGVTKDILQRFSLLGIVKHSLVIDKEYDLRAEEVEWKWRTRQHPLAVEFPELGIFPYPVQQLLVEEIHQGKLLVGEEEVPEPLAAAPEVLLPVAASSIRSGSSHAAIYGSTIFSLVF